jgi:DNA mismatch repair protein MutL
LKELVENSLDAGATKIEVNINDGGKSYLSVEDNGSGIELSDMDLVLERYATSKIQTDEDLYTISSYGFRGEALASIAEVSKTTILTKTKYAEIGTKLVKKGGEVIVKHQPVGFAH